VLHQVSVGSTHKVLSLYLWRMQEPVAERGGGVLCFSGHLWCNSNRERLVTVVRRCSVWLKNWGAPQDAYLMLDDDGCTWFTYERFVREERGMECA
jgi:hypothetical protein